MRILSILLILSSSIAFAQRVEFNDPDLTFSFVKPTEWTLHDGPTIFVLPENEQANEPITFFSITYFEGPSQTELNEGIFDAVEVEPSIPSDLKEFNPDKTGRIYIANETALWVSYFHTQNKIRVKAVSYVFIPNYALEKTRGV